MTHLFDAMSQLGSREPGPVGATLTHDDVFAGVIANCIHVHPATIRAEIGADRMFLITDAMATAGSFITEFKLNGRRLFRRKGRLSLADGTLAGAVMEISLGIYTLVNKVGDPIASTISRVTSTPARILRYDFGLGRFRHRIDNLVYLDRALSSTCSVRTICGG